MIKKMLILFFLLMLYPSITPVNSQEIKAKTEDGKDVILYPDGTWHYLKAAEPQSLPPDINPQPSKKLIEGKRGVYGIWIDENKWRISEDKFNPAAEFCFVHTGGDAYAIIIDEGMQMPLEMLQNNALDNIKRTAPDIHIIDQGKRTINNNEILYMKMQGTVQMKPFTYLGYYYAGNEGTIQFVAYTAQDFFRKYEPDLVDFLNGLKIGSKAQEERNLSDGSKYIGTLVNGKMHGQGTYIWPNGDKYVGEFADNRATGGWFYKSDGRKAWCHQDENGTWIIKKE